MMELPARPGQGRRYSARRTVRVSDAGPDGALRLDGVARYLQDVATDDWVDAGLSTSATWVVRRAYVELAGAGCWPRYGDEVNAVTWCAGTGPAWAERRTDLEVEGQVRVRATALWVLVDQLGRPLRLEEGFHQVYGEACQDRKASGRVPAPPPMPGLLGAPGVRSRPWFVRKADVDVVGHVNNAAIWSAVVEVAPDGLQAVDLVHHAPVEADSDVLLSWWPGHLCLVAGEGAARPAKGSNDSGGPPSQGPVTPGPGVKVSATLSVAAGPAEG